MVGGFTPKCSTYQTAPSYNPHLALQGNYAYVNIGTTLYIFDISNPTHMTPVGTLDTPWGIEGLAVQGNYMYLTGDSRYTKSISIVDISNPAGPTVVGYHTPPVAVVEDLLVVKDHVYIPTSLEVPERYKLRVVDVSNPSVPIALGAFNLPFASTEVMGDYAYVAAGNLRVWDVSHPATPTEVISLSTPAGTVAVSGNYAYVGGGSELNVIDISNPISPTAVGRLVLPEKSVAHVVVNGRYAYLAEAHYPGLIVVDVSDPVSPTELGSVDLTSNIFEAPIGLAAAGNYVFLGGTTTYSVDYSSLRVIDVSNPISPTTVCTYFFPDAVWSMAMGEEYIYAANEQYGVRVIDVTQPTTPTEVYVYNTPGRAEHVRASGSHIYVADLEGGLLVLQAYHHFSYLPLLLRN